jgi:hypothetical protein
MYEATPGAYPAYSSPLRPTSSSSRHSVLVDDVEQRMRRSRSSSTASYSQQIHTPPYPVDPATAYQYAAAQQQPGAPALQPQGAPAAYVQVQRHRMPVGGAADVAYAAVPRRVPVGGPAGVAPRIPASNSDPTLGGGVAFRASALHNDLSEDTEEDGAGTDETDEGVRLNVGADGGADAGVGARRDSAGASGGRERKSSGSSRRHSVSNGHGHSSRHASSRDKERHRKGKK